MSNFLFQSSDMTVDELCRICAVHTEYVVELVQEGILAPCAGSAYDTWRFTSLQVRHAKIASRLQRDLGVNLAGAALALQLLDELETLRAQMSAAGVNGVVDALG
jgi:chaperone modulatory protein CbpM